MPSAALTAGTGGFPHVEVLEGETTLGRHRRPESLADETVLRPPATDRIAGGRRASLDLSPRSRSARPARNRPPRGRHSGQDQPLVTVRALPRPRSASGAHRATGPLPKLSRTRQQVLLASLIVVGLFAIIVPMQQRGSDPAVDTVAADRALKQAGKAKAEQQKVDAEPAGKKQDEEPSAIDPAEARDPARPVGATPEPTAKAPAASAAPSATTPAILVPPGDGPGQSLRTTGTSTVALTFDDGPDPVQTPKLLAMLDKYRVKATFCLVGSQVQRHPDIVRDIVDAGHTLCNHTWDHSLTIGKDKPEKIRKDLAKTNAAIRAAVPDAEIPFFRAPGGNFTDVLVQTAYVDGMTSLYWQVDPADWDHPEGEKDDDHVEKILKAVQKNTSAGSIILSHDFNQPDTIKAYETLIPWLQARYTLGIPSVPPAPTAAPSSPAPPPVGAAGVVPSSAPAASSPPSD